MTVTRDQEDVRTGTHRVRLICDLGPNVSLLTISQCLNDMETIFTVSTFLTPEAQRVRQLSGEIAGIARRNRDHPDGISMRSGALEALRAERDRSQSQRPELLRRVLRLNYSNPLDTWIEVTGSAATFGFLMWLGTFLRDFGPSRRKAVAQARTAEATASEREAEALNAADRVNQYVALRSALVKSIQSEHEPFSHAVRELNLEQMSALFRLTESLDYVADVSDEDPPQLTQ